jgi:hypothetical protein
MTICPKCNNERFIRKGDYVRRIEPCDCLETAKTTERERLLKVEARERELLDAMGLLEGVADNFKAKRDKLLERHSQMIAELKAIPMYMNLFPASPDNAPPCDELIRRSQIEAVIKKFD